MKPPRQFQKPKEAELGRALKIAKIQKLQASAYKDRQDALDQSLMLLDPTRNRGSVEASKTQISQCKKYIPHH
jgi:hypothetical protein